MDSSAAATNNHHHHQKQRQRQKQNQNQNKLHHSKVVPKQWDKNTNNGKNPSSISSSRRTASFSSSSSSFSPSSSSVESLYFHDDPVLFSPASSTPPLRFSGVPFSWEHLPGIPKKNHHQESSSSSMKLLPLMPPPTNNTTTTHNSSNNQHHEVVVNKVRKKNLKQSTFQRDPFFAALVECSKDVDDDHDHDHDHDDHDQDQESTTTSSSSRSSFWGGPKVTRSISDRFGFIGLYASCKRTCAVSESIVYLPSSRRTTYEHVTRRSL